MATEDLQVAAVTQLNGTLSETNVKEDTAAQTHQLLPQQLSDSKSVLVFY